jgi:hypothetical protein
MRFSPRWRKATWALAIFMVVYNVLMGLWIVNVWSTVGMDVEEAEAACTHQTNTPACLATAHAGSYNGLVVLIILWFIGLVVLPVVWLASTYVLAKRPVVAPPAR